MNEIGYIGGMNQQLGENPAVPQQQTIYERHEQAVRDYHSVCHQFAQISAMRDQCAKVLQAATEELAKVMQEATYDPTVPQPSCPPPMQARNGYR